MLTKKSHNLKGLKGARISREDLTFFKWRMYSPFSRTSIASSSYPWEETEKEVRGTDAAAEITVHLVFSSNPTKY